MPRRPTLLTVALTSGIVLASLTTGLPSAQAHPGVEGVRYCASVDAYRIRNCSEPPAIPHSGAGTQLGWVLQQFGTGASALTEAEVSAHFSAGYLSQVAPASEIVTQIRQTVEQLGPFDYQGLLFPPRDRDVVALVGTGIGERGAIAVSVNAAGRIDSLLVQAAPVTIVPHGRHSGMFDVGGRRMFLRCTGRGSPTIVFELGLTTDWQVIQDAVSPTTRVCSYDPPNANGPFSRSDPAPTPRTSADVVADLHRLLRVAGVPGPYVLAGFSNGGLNSLLYAATHPHEVSGLMLIDGVHPDYYARRFAMLRPLLDPQIFDALVKSALTLPPRLLDPEQFDIVTSQAQTQAALSTHPLRPLPLTVLTHEIANPPPPGIDNWPVAADEALWTALQDELAALSPDSRHLVATGASHDIPLERPELVTRELVDLVARVRSTEGT